MRLLSGMRFRTPVWSTAELVDVILPMQRTKVSSGDLVVSSCNSGIGIGFAAIVALLKLNIDPALVRPPSRHSAGKTNPSEREVNPLNGTTIRLGSAKSS